MDFFAQNSVRVFVFCAPYRGPDPGEIAHPHVSAYVSAIGHPQGPSRTGDGKLPVAHIIDAIG